jgi:uncharacterized protein (DUF1800 family)
VGYLAIARPAGEEKARIVFGELDVVQPDGATWFTETFAEVGEAPYTTPVVVFGPVSWKNGEPAMIRVRNVTATSFEYQIDEFDYQDDVHPLEQIGYVVMEAGTYEIGGLRWTAGRKTGVTHVAATQAFSPAFPAAPALPPAVFTQVASAADAAPVVERLSNVLTTGFTVQLDEEEGAANRAHGAETLHYLAIARGSARFNLTGMIFQAGVSANTITSVGFTNVSYSRKIALPVVLGDIQTRNDQEPVVPRQTNSIYESLISLLAREETSANPELIHGLETSSFLALSTALDLDEDGISDAWELAHGLDPNTAADAALDPDGDGQQNVAEFRWGTSPNSYDSAGTITITADIPTAYERNNTEGVTPGRVRINRTGGVVPATIYFTLSGTATAPGTGADYSTEYTSGQTLSGAVGLGLNSTAAYVVIDPVADALNEYPETVTVTLAADGTTTTSGRYTVGTPASANVTINDATDIPAHEQLFVAFLTPVTGSSASGLGTMFLNGPKTSARVSLDFNGLTSAQTNAYIRYGGDGAVGTEMRPNLGNGNLQNVIWSVVPVGVYDGQEIIDALYQLGGKWIYSNIGTVGFTNGEIAGKWRAQAGSVTLVPPDPAPPITALTGAALERDVARFLTQATFGPTEAEIDALVTSITTTHADNRINGFNAWIDTQLAYDQTKLYDYAWAADAQEWALRGIDIKTVATYDPANAPRGHNRRRAWWAIATKARDQFRHRAAFALSEIFVVSSVEGTVQNYHYGQANFYDMLGSHVAGTSPVGNFRTLLEDVSKHPIMGQYLSSLRNRKAVVTAGPDGILGNADDVTVSSPDENYAREIMQLFSIGLAHRHLDGSLKLNAATSFVTPTYTNDDITNLARVFTGWGHSKNNGNNGTTGPRANVIDNTNFFSGSTSLWHQDAWKYPMINFAPYHDTAAKTVLGSPIAAGLDGEADLDAALTIIFNHPNVAPFICRQLIQRLVTSNPSPGYVYRVAQKFVNNGSGGRGDMKAVFKAILLDYEARTLSVAADDRFGKQKEPLVRYVQLLRALGAKSNMPLSALLNPTLAVEYRYPAGQYDNFPVGTTLYRHYDTNGPLAQTPLHAPTVFNWFLPDYSPGGAIAANGLFAPEMQITTETSTIAAINIHHILARSIAGQGVEALFGTPPLPDPAATLDDIKPDFAPLVALYDSASGDVTAKTTAALDYLDNLLMAGNLKARYPAVTVPANPRNTFIDAVASMTFTGTTATELRMRELLYLVVTSPEYIHQK